MKKCAKCKHLFGRFGAWVGCELTNKEIKHPYLTKCPRYESCRQIKISKNKYGDTRHAPKGTTFKQFHKANVEPIEDALTYSDIKRWYIHNNHLKKEFSLQAISIDSSSQRAERQ